MKYQSVKGLQDILPGEVRAWQELERIARLELGSSGYNEVRTPILEDTAIFIRSIGETTDIVTKEMYTFQDRKGRSLTMRPEGTAPIVRAYIEHSLGSLAPITRLYYMGPMFRSERPQKGRSRQFHQIGVEIIGSYAPAIDFEVLWRLNALLCRFGLEGFSIKVNSLGCKKDKAAYAEKLKDHLQGEKARLCEDCKARMEKNVLRVLDCKNESCVAVARGVPLVSDSLCPECAEHFTAVKAMLRSEGVRFDEVGRLVRGLDYYTGIVFEVTHPGLGGQDALAAGGRYDALVKDMGGSDVGATGFALGVERVLLALGDKVAALPQPAVVSILMMDKNARQEGFRLAEEIKSALNADRLRVVTLVDLGESSLNAQMRRANKDGARIVVILGGPEQAGKTAIVKNMTKDEGQASMAMGSVVQKVKEGLGLC